MGFYGGTYYRQKILGECEAPPPMGDIGKENPRIGFKLPQALILRGAYGESVSWYVCTWLWSLLKFPCIIVRFLPYMVDVPHRGVQQQTKRLADVNQGATVYGTVKNHPYTVISAVIPGSMLSYAATKKTAWKSARAKILRCIQDQKPGGSTSLSLAQKSQRNKINIWLR